MLVDTHAHLDGFVRDGSLPGMLARASVAGVERILAIGGNREANDGAIAAAGVHPKRVAAAVGLDRDRAGDPGLDRELSVLRERLSSPFVVAVGETGLDFHYGADTADAQRDLFRQMAALAGEAGLPLVVHSRDAVEDTLEILTGYVHARGGCARAGVLHCFTGDAAFAGRLVELGFFISFSGILTFRNAAVIQAAATEVPADRLLIETDTPYLAPVPHRGRPNEPAWLVPVADELARLRGWSREETARITAENAARLFGPWAAGKAPGGT